MTEQLTKILLDAWVKHPSTRPGERGDPDNVFFSARRAAEVLTPIVTRLSEENARLRRQLDGQRLPVFDKPEIEWPK